jgi:hypothetical protein
MVTKDDNILDNLSYEEALLVVCDKDIERFNKIYREIMPLINSIPVGWNEND